MTCLVSSPLFAVVTAWAMIAMKATTATPIMSAADVVAVRPGFRRAFSLASVPGRPAKRRSGAPAISTIGPTSRLADAAVPRIRASEPIAISISRVFALEGFPSTP